jgi:hypothetical protein
MIGAQNISIGSANFHTQPVILHGTRNGLRAFKKVVTWQQAIMRFRDIKEIL